MESHVFSYSFLKIQAIFVILSMHLKMGRFFVPSEIPALSLSLSSVYLPPENVIVSFGI